MNRRDSDSFGNPTHPATVSPDEFERQVVGWLRAEGSTLDNFSVSHLEHIPGTAGDYEFDAVARFTVLGGAEMTVLVECKRHSRPVEREKVMALWAKLQDVRADKAMMFATCGFQRGALEYAGSYGIATLIFVQGEFIYCTKSVDAAPNGLWPGDDRYVALFTTVEGTSISYATISSDRTDELSAWLAA